MDILKISTRDTWKNIVGLILVLGVLIVLSRYVNIASLREQIEQAGAIAPILLVAAKASTIIIAPLGGSPLYAVAGALFGFWKGSLFLLLGDTIGGVVSFLLARLFGRRLVERMIGDGNGMLGRALELMGTPKGFFIARICFMTFPEMACWGAGLTKLKFIPFTLIYTAGSIPSVLLAAWLGSFVAETSDWVLVPVVTIGSILISAIAFTVFLKLIGKKEEELVTQAESLQK